MSDDADHGLLSGMFGARPDWLAAVLTVEAALAGAAAATGRIPAATAAVIAQACRPELFDRAGIARRAADYATPIPPLVANLRALLPPDIAVHAHRPATSQDITDSALMLIAARAIDGLTDDLDFCVTATARLAEDHRDTPQLGRTLLAAAVPTTFGRLAATWHAGLAEARDAVARVRRERLAAQLGGPVGDLDEPALVTAFAHRLGLVAPSLCWHTNRVRVAELAAALGMVTGVLGKLGQDVLLLAQAEIGELAEGRPGGSSAMPHKRNSARSVQLVACAHRAPGLVATVFAAMPQELQRAAGAWQAEWEPVADLLALATAAIGHGRVLLTELRVDTVRMRDGLR
ncbi:MAG TPA: lyase family protein [Pseudonocardiaceae bacterium]|jgi:3-carboxy-cis,cis-muconate cycloisomerase|nr:lyase family protein [Pseudonocardiaceae bacterium]